MQASIFPFTFVVWQILPMEPMVRLKLGRLQFFSGGGFTGSFAPISVKVKNAAFDKDVAVLYSPDTVNWKSMPLAFASHFGDYDIFSGTVNEQVREFAIRYAAGGQVSFDNNDFRNYQFGPRLTTVGGNVVLNVATARQGNQAGGGFVFTTSWLEGEILVNDLAFAKDVGVRVSADGGITWADTHGFFSGVNAVGGIFVGSGAEVWRFKTPELNLNNASPDFRFAVFYRLLATGETFWDNNFRQDYKVSKADGASID